MDAVSDKDYMPVRVSVIVPVYNGEKHLRQCLDSICYQTLREIEIICVDDGSTDRSFEILQEYKARDNRIQLYRQENKFAGAARNLGKSYATGEYLMFWDCDDFFALNALEELYSRAVSCQADICVCGAGRYYDDTGQEEPFYTGYLNMKKVPEKDVFSRKTNEEHIIDFTCTAAWNKMYRRGFIEEAGLDFKEIRNGNDVYFSVLALCLAERISAIDKVLVTYRRNRRDSLVNTIATSPISLFETWVETAESLMKLDAFPKQSFICRAISDMLFSLRNIDDHEAFAQAFYYLKNVVLKKTGLTEIKDDDIYYVKWHKEVVDHLLHDTLEEFQTFLVYRNYKQMSDAATSKRIATVKLKEARRKIKKYRKTIAALKKELAVQKKINADCQAEINKIKASYSYRLGRAFTWLPRTIRSLFIK